MSMICGWMPSKSKNGDCGASTCTSDSEVTSCSVIVVKDRPVGNGRREILTQGDDSLVRVHIDPALYPETTKWLEIRGARKLICPGVRLQVEGVLGRNDMQEKDESKETPVAQDVWAIKIVVTMALPATPYLALMLSMPIPVLHQLFPGPVNDTVPLSLVCAIQPCSIHRCEALCQKCRDEKDAGRGVILFKNKDLIQLCRDMRAFQGWSRKERDVPPTSPTTWQALLRMEQRWCRECDGSDESCLDACAQDLTSSSHHGRVVFGGKDVDPSLNLPNPSDERRQRYINERKRPQIMWMLNLIRRLVAAENVEETGEPRVVRFADIGGGRGDLANAVAAFFAQKQVRERIHAHVTVLDVNQTSLEAGRERAVAADLGAFMSFVLCDLSNKGQIDQLLGRENFDLVFGLHCCGGVAEAAVELALTSRAHFCVSTCCFRSNHHLASLSRLADTIVLSGDNDCRASDAANVTSHAELEQHREDRSLVSALSVLVGGHGQHRAIRAMNAMRLVAAERRFADIVVGEDLVGSGISGLRTWQECFPVEYSVQNRVMIGMLE